jgi:hypothetical protein
MGLPLAMMPAMLFPSLKNIMKLWPLGLLVAGERWSHVVFRIRLVHHIQRGFWYPGSAAGLAGNFSGGMADREGIQFISNHWQSQVSPNYAYGKNCLQVKPRSLN